MMLFRIKTKYLVTGGAVAAVLGVVALISIATDMQQYEAMAEPSIQPSLSVNVARLLPQTLTNKISANGDVAAWQEVTVGTEIGDLRLVEVRVDVGDEVSKGQVLAVHASDTARVDLAKSRAVAAEASATLAEASANAQRARSLKNTGALSDQQIQQYETAEMTARARLGSAQADIEARELRLAQTRIVAPDDGVIIARVATVGAVTSSGQALFRLIRNGRLEWRAEVTASDLEQLQPGQNATVTVAENHVLVGRVRTIAPLVDGSTRHGLVYVDLPASDVARAGMFARGEFSLGTRQALTLPRTAVQLRDGFGYVHRINDDNTVLETKVAVGQQSGDRVEIISGLDTAARVVASGGAFLRDGDHVRVIEAGGDSSRHPGRHARAHSTGPAILMSARYP